MNECVSLVIALLNVSPVDFKDMIRCVSIVNKYPTSVHDDESIKIYPIAKSNDCNFTCWLEI